jgi:hypothetical protein
MIREIQKNKLAEQSLKSIIKDRPVFLFAQGPTVQKYSEYKNFFQSENVCYVCIGRFELSEDLIPEPGYDILFRSDTRCYLSSIKETTDFIERENETAWIIKHVDPNSEEYTQRRHLWAHEPADGDEQIDVHRLSNKSPEQESNIKSFCNNIEYYKSHKRIYGDSSIFHDNAECPCTMAAALSLLFYLDVISIYIFGFDGGPIKGEDYFKSEQSDYLGNGGTDIAGVIEDTRKFNQNFWRLSNRSKYYDRVFNVSPESNVANLKKISHEDLVFHWRN